MQNQASPSRYLSPKRKRCDQDSLLVEARSPSRLKTTSLPTRPVLKHACSNEGSPRTNVAGHLQNLDLEEHIPISNLDFGISTKSRVSSSETTPRSGSFNPNIVLPDKTYDAPITPPPKSNGPFATWVPAQTEDGNPIAPLEIPETPRLCPVSSLSPPSSAEKSRSPPPLSPTLWWHDEEITGHNPNDPTDDGYGINGIGFLPTPAIASARAERRKKQVAEWKNREAREARQKRGDRRRRRDLESGPSASCTKHEKMANESRKVRFLEI